MSEWLDVSLDEAFSIIAAMSRTTRSPIMAEYDNRNRFSLWKNPEYKPDDNKSSMLKGTFTDENGVEYFMDLYKNISDNPAAPAYSGKVKRKDKQPGTAAPAATKAEPVAATSSVDDLL